MSYCPECGEQVEQDAEFCGNCGADLTSQQEENSQSDHTNKADKDGHENLGFLQSFNPNTWTTMGWVWSFLGGLAILGSLGGGKEAPATFMFGVTLILCAPLIRYFKTSNNSMIKQWGSCTALLLFGATVIAGVQGTNKKSSNNQTTSTKQTNQANAQSQTQEKKDKRAYLYPVSAEDGRGMGLINEDGEVVVKTEYQEIKTVSEGLIPAKNNDKWGYIDRENEAVIPFKYSKAKQFSGGFAAVATGDVRFNRGEWKFINPQEKVVIKGPFTDAHSFSEGLAAVCKNVTVQGDHSKREEEKCGYIDKEGSEKVAFKFEPKKFKSFSGGLAAVKSRKVFKIQNEFNKNEIITISEEFKTKIKQMLKEAENDQLDYWTVEENRSAWEKSVKDAWKRLGGKKSIFETARKARKNLWEIAIKESPGAKSIEQALSDHGNISSDEPDFDEQWKDKALEIAEKSSESNGFEYPKRVKEAMAIRDVADEISSYTREVKNKIQDAVQKAVKTRKYDKKWGFINKDGEVKISYRFKSVGNFSEGLAKACLEDKCGYINKKGEFQIGPKNNYLELTNFSEGLAAVKIKTKKAEEKWGFINSNGKKVIDFEYGNVKPFSSGLAYAYKNDQRGYIDKSGNWALKVDFNEANSFKGPLAKVTEYELDGRIIRDRRHGYINKDGEVIYGNVGGMF